jgi:hypothetical protein
MQDLFSTTYVSMSRYKYLYWKALNKNEDILFWQGSFVLLKCADVLING